MTCGIYMIQNLVNFKIYIGQSVNIEDRWGDHKYELNKGYHHNKHLQKSWRKYGQENFEFTIICECDESQLNTMEEYYIFELMTYDPDFGYNKTYGGGGGRPTEETIMKNRESNKRAYSKPEVLAKIKGSNNGWYGKHGKDNPQSIPIVQLNKDEHLVRIWESSMEAEKNGGFGNSNINHCLKGRLKTYRGYKWMYLSEYMDKYCGIIV